MISSARADLFVISHPDAGLTEADIKAVYGGDKASSGGTTLKPVDNKAAQDAFLSQILGGTNKGAYDAKWAKKNFQEGLNPPEVLNSDADVIAFVKRTPGAIGYVGSDPGGGVTVLKKN